MRDELKIEKLSDEFGQYNLVLSCPCGHVRRAPPDLLARICGWDAQLAHVAKRLRCSKCGKLDCTVKAVALSKPRGLRDART